VLFVLLNMGHILEICLISPIANADRDILSREVLRELFNSCSLVQKM